MRVRGDSGKTVKIPIDNRKSNCARSSRKTLEVLTLVGNPDVSRPLASGRVVAILNRDK